jgi:hypothetical protein
MDSGWISCASLNRSGFIGQIAGHLALSENIFGMDFQDGFRGFLSVQYYGANGSVA